MVVVILIGTLIAFYRPWEEIHEVEEPDSPADLLESFRQAHAEGSWMTGELDRVRSLLSAGGRGRSRTPLHRADRGEGLQGPRDSSAPPRRSPDRPGRGHGASRECAPPLDVRGADVARGAVPPGGERFSDRASERPLRPLRTAGRIDPDLRLADEAHELGHLGDEPRSASIWSSAPPWRPPFA